MISGYDIKIILKKKYLYRPRYSEPTYIPFPSLILAICKNIM